MAIRIDAEKLIGRLEEIKYDGQADDEQSHIEQMSLGGVLPALANIHHDKQYELSRQAAHHLLGRVQEPEDIGIE
jgi:hypothetical protein